MGSYVQQLAESIQAELNNTSEDQFWANRCIYRVPKLTRDSNEDSYTPMVVSIGPYHHKNERLSSMEFYKLAYLKSFLCFTKDNANLNSYLEIIDSKREKIRAAYADPFSNNFDEFLRKILIDAIFIIELFRRHDSDPSQTKGDLILGSVTVKRVLRDLLLVENQLPFFILKEIYWHGLGKQRSDKTNVPSLTDVACKFFAISRSGIKVYSALNEAICCHLLDLFLAISDHPVKLTISFI